ncbi:MAG: UPF0149 family protein [Burkholderiaceae bacterium]|nr:UPF0149 family protein [Burkholderiaceae bacterium]
MNLPVRNPAKALNDAELSELDSLLEQANSDGAMVLEEFDGFCTALACSPVPAATADVLHEIIGLDASQAVAAASERLLALIERHRLSIVAALHGGDDLAPVFESADDGSSPANLWAVGFLRGIDAQSDQWADIDENQALADLLAPFEALAAERDFETGEVAEPLPAPRHKLVDDMIDAAFAYYEWFEPARRRHAAPQTVRHDQPVPGRNAACPCGSGRKFKQCCGAGR